MGTPPEPRNIAASRSSRSSSSWCNYGPQTLGAVPLWVNLFGPCAQVGRALGLAADLPDLTNRAALETLWRMPSDTWKEPFEGLVADTMRNGDRGWMRLVDLPFGIAFFDLEEGVKFNTTIDGLSACLEFIVSLSGKGIRLWDTDYMEGYGGESGACVWVSPAIQLPTLDPEPVFREVGLVQGGPDSTSPWLMPPDWKAAAPGSF